MPSVRFPFDAQLVSVRREVCPHARWDKVRRVWTMTPVEAQTFLAAGHARLDYCRMTAKIAVDEELWLIGFIEGAPKRQA
jgi:hypothetical protein